MHRLLTLVHKLFCIIYVQLLVLDDKFILELHLNTSLISCFPVFISFLLSTMASDFIQWEILIMLDLLISCPESKLIVLGFSSEARGKRWPCYSTFKNYNIEGNVLYLYENQA